MSIHHGAIHPEPAPLTDLRALTVKQPWATCIASGEKPIENRTWATNYRGPLAIHAGSAWDTAAVPMDSTSWVMAAFYRAKARLRVKGAIVAVADLVGCHRCEPGCCASQWAEQHEGVWHWELAQVRDLAEPVPCKGVLRLWRPTAEVLERVTAQLAVSG